MQDEYDKGGESEFSGFHPLVIFAYFASVIIAAMLSMSPYFIIPSFLASFIYSVMLGGARAARYNLLFLAPILLLMAVINPLSNHRGATVLFYLSGNAITLEAVLYGVAAAALMVSVIMWFSCFSRVISSDKIIYLLGRIVPVLALLLSMCFRFVPLLKNRFREISEGQKCMGRQHGRRQPIRRIRQLAREFSILIAWSLEAAIETSDSMEARGYGLRGRTSFHLYKFLKRDGLALGFILLTAAIVFIGFAIGAGGIYFYPLIRFTYPVKSSLPFAAVYVLLLAFPILVEIYGDFVNGDEKMHKKVGLKMYRSGVRDLPFQTGCC